jgi:pimeloyl-ACP methyl ester carboxylesterase
VKRRLVEGVAVREWGGLAEPGVLMWPGLGSTGGYFASVAEAMPGRAVAVDPPGFGDSPPLEPCTSERLVELARAVISECGCRAIVGHSLGAYLAVALASDPPVELRAVVLIDGGYLRVDEMVELGQPPVSASRSELVAWLSRHRLRFRDWDTAIQEIAAMFDSSVTPALEAYLREVLVEVNGEVRDPRSPERMADLLVAARSRDTPALAHQIAVPTLLIACAKQPEHRELRQTAWQRFADASPQIQLHVAETWSHNPIMEAPVASANLIADWLRAHL